MEAKEMNPGTLVYIPIDKLNPHPDNPRKELGDLTELADSIKASGILQNLTVVPYVSPVHNRVIQGLYTVIIGHRRCAAAELAGLKELPCVIVEMSKEEQIATMLAENMQRSDLTAYEEGMSFQQLAIDFGKTTDEIAAMSGVSSATVRSRQKIAKLPGEKVKKGYDRGATLADFIALEKIEDPEAKEKCLDAIGTPNFKNALQSALDKQKYQQRRAKWLEQLAGFATQIEQRYYVGEEYVEMNYFRNYGSWSKAEDIEVPSDADEKRYFYLVGEFQIDIYVECIKDSEAEKEQKRKQELRDKQEAKYKQLCAISERHYGLRRDFVVNFGASKSNVDKIINAALDAMYKQGERNYYSGYDYETLAELTGLEYDKELRKVNPVAFREFKAKTPEHALLLMFFWMMDGEEKSYIKHDWNSQKQLYMCYYKDNQTLDQVYYILEELGYQTSDEELQMRRGTHKLFDKQEEE